MDGPTTALRAAGPRLEISAMGFIRLLLLLAVGLLVWYAFNAWKRRSGALARRAPRRVVTVRCDRCGVHVPRNEAVLRDGRSYCCEAHVEAKGGNGES